MNFPETQQYLLSLGNETVAIKLGLRNTEVLLAELGDPHESFQSVQIAGTNGKGSTAVVLESICQEAGIQTGLFTSPHLVSITERIKIDGSNISEHDFAHHATRVRAAAEELLASQQLDTLPTYFEHVTAIAFLAFKAAGVELAILETGLGGRLDATTVARASTVAITPISLDHQEYLGETLRDIASEKAAIIRPGVMAIVGPQPAEALDVILQQCKESDVIPDLDQCRISIDDVMDGWFRVTVETNYGLYDRVLLSLRGRHQIRNVATAIKIAEALATQDFEISREAIMDGVRKARHPGRLEMLPGTPPILVDGAHNPSGALALRRFFDEFSRQPLTIVFGAMNDKRIGEMAAILFAVADCLIFTKADHPRAAAPEDLLGIAQGLNYGTQLFTASTLGEAIELAKEKTPDRGTICVTGSLYLVGEAIALRKAGNALS